MHLEGWLQKRGWPHIFSMPQHCFVAKQLNTTLFCRKTLKYGTFCRETLKYGTFCRETLKYTLWAEKWHKLRYKLTPDFLQPCSPTMSDVRLLKHVETSGDRYWHASWWLLGRGLFLVIRNLAVTASNAPTISHNTSTFITTILSQYIIECDVTREVHFWNDRIARTEVPQST